MLPALRTLLAPRAREITELFNQALNAGWREAIRSFDPNHSTSSQPTEPDLIHGIFAVSVPMIDAAFPVIFKGSGIAGTVSSVFCHQSPIVELAHPASNGKKRCELGDILFVFVCRDGRTVERYALLMQAKFLHDHGICPFSSITLDDQTPQFILYNEWPQFHYYRGMSGRRFVDGGWHRGAQYMLICNERAFWAPAWLHSYSSMPLRPSRTIPLEGELFDMLMGQTGRRFSDRATAMGGEGWDRIVWDLIDSTASHAFNLQSSGVRGLPRGSTHIISGSLEPPQVMSSISGISQQDIATQWSQRSGRLIPPITPSQQRSDKADDIHRMLTIFVDLAVNVPTA